MVNAGSSALCVEYPSSGVGEPGVIDYIVNVKGFASAEAGRPISLKTVGVHPRVQCV